MILAAERNSKPRHPARTKIMVVGGDGEVGKLAGKLLAKRYPNRVIIARRCEQEARKVSEITGYGANWRQIDVDSRIPADVLDGVGLVLACLDRPDAGFVTQCLATGIHYLDVSTRYGFLRRVEALDATAQSSNSTAILSVGLAPGLTNLMAAQAARMFDKVERIDIFVRLALGAKLGGTAIEWILDSLEAPYPVYENGRLRLVRSFGESKAVRFPNEAYRRWAHRFAFSDQMTLGNSFCAASVSTWLCFDNRAATALVASIAKSRLARILHKDPWRARTVRFLRSIKSGSDAFTVSVRASGAVNGRRSVVELDVGGPSGCLMTALIAEHAVKLVAEHGPPAGVWHIEQVMALADVVPAMKAQGVGLFANAAVDPVLATSHHTCGSIAKLADRKRGSA